MPNIRTVFCTVLSKFSGHQIGSSNFFRIAFNFYAFICGYFSRWNLLKRAIESILISCYVRNASLSLQFPLPFTYQLKIKMFDSIDKRLIFVQYSALCWANCPAIKLVRSNFFRIAVNFYAFNLLERAIESILISCYVRNAGLSLQFPSQLKITKIK